MNFRPTKQIRPTHEYRLRLLQIYYDKHPTSESGCSFTIWRPNRVQKIRLTDISTGWPMKDRHNLRSSTNTAGPTGPNHCIAALQTTISIRRSSLWQCTVCLHDLAGCRQLYHRTYPLCLTATSTQECLLCSIWGICSGPLILGHSSRPLQSAAETLHHARQSLQSVVKSMFNDSYVYDPKKTITHAFWLA